MQQDIQTYEYLLYSCFFQSSKEDIRKSNVKVHLTVTKKGDMFDFTFKFNGTITIPCDRCLDDVDFHIDSVSHLTVMFGEKYSDESEKIIIISEKEGCIDIGWFLYETIVLKIPIRHIHPQGQCNKQMLAKLRECEVKTTTIDGENKEKEIALIGKDYK